MHIIDDGLLDLWLFSGSNLGDALRHAYELWRGNHVNQTRPPDSLPQPARGSRFSITGSRPTANHAAPRNMAEISVKPAR